MFKDLTWLGAEFRVCRDLGGRDRQEDGIRGDAVPAGSRQQAARKVGEPYSVRSFQLYSRESGAEVAACYSAHPGAPLLCRDAVLQFTDAVQRSRLDLVKSG